MDALLLPCNSSHVFSESCPPSQSPSPILVQTTRAVCQSLSTLPLRGNRNGNRNRSGIRRSRLPLVAASAEKSAGVRVAKSHSCSDLLKGLSILQELEEQCATPVERLRDVADAMIGEMNAGLAKDGGSEVKMLLTYVDKLPSGEEKGLSYALDLGGTNFRVLRVQLGDGDNPASDPEFVEVCIPHEAMHGTTEELFDFIAGQLASFVSEEGEKFQPLPGRKRELGFTFSFPVKQTSIDSGTLIKWTKGFTVKGTAGKDVVQVLNEALERQGLDMKVTALVNDTVGTLAVAALNSLKAGKQHEQEVMIAVILGTGTNACYVERISSIPKWKGPIPKSGSMVINMEWGGLYSSHLPISQYDLALDADTVNPGEQCYEKLLSGLYLGDLVRRVLQRIGEETTLFGEQVPSKLQQAFTLSTPDVSCMHRDQSPDLQKVGEILDAKLGIKDTSLETRKLVVDVCSVIPRRAARLAGAGITGILKKIGRDGGSGNNGTKVHQHKKTVVAMDGGLYEHYPEFRMYLQESVLELLGESVANDIKIELTKDGSGIGAALLAAANSSYLKH